MNRGLLMVSCLCLGADVHAATDACVPAALAGAIDDAQRRAATEDRAWQWTQRLVLEVGQRPAGTAAEQRALPDGGQAPALVPALAAWLEPLGIALDEGRAAIGGTDLEPLRRRGVPVYDLDPDASEYFDVHHTDNDTLAHVSRDGLRQHVSAFASFALLFGGAPDDCVTSQSAGAGGNDMRRGTPREH